MQDIPYRKDRIQPLFGVPIQPSLLHFCGACHHGFTLPSTLRSHQSDYKRCDGPRDQRTTYIAYGQTLSQGQYKRYYPVDVSRLSRREDDPLKYATIFGSLLEPLPDYSKLAVQDIDDEQNLDSFLHASMWLDVVKGLTPADIVEAVRLPDHKTEAWGKNLQAAAIRALDNIQPLVGKTQGYGLAQDLAQVNHSYVKIIHVDSRIEVCHRNNTTSNNFNRVGEETRKKYGNVLARLIFSVMRSLEPTWISDVRYPPLDRSQEAALHKLRSTLDANDPILVDQSFYQVCYLLFAHEQRQYAVSSHLDEFCSCVNVFLVYSSMRLDGSFRVAGDITAICAALEYCIRGTMLVKITTKSKEENVSIFSYVAIILMFFRMLIGYSQRSGRGFEVPDNERRDADGICVQRPSCSQVCQYG